MTKPILTKMVGLETTSNLAVTIHLFRLPHESQNQETQRPTQNTKERTFGSYLPPRYQKYH